MYLKVNFKNRKRAYALVTNAAMVHGQGLHAISRDYLEQALKCWPECEEALFNLAVVHYQLYDYKKCLEIGARYFKVSKDPVAALASYLADAGNRAGEFENGIKYSRIFCALLPSDPVCYNTLGVILFKKHYLAETLTSYHRALAIQPTLQQAINNLGLAYKSIGDYKKCTYYALEMAKWNTDASDVFKNLLTSYLYYPFMPAKELEEAQKKWINVFTNNNPVPAIKTNLNPNRKLRIAVVSSDLYAHPVGRNFLSVFINADRNFVEFVCYSNAPKEDQLTQAYKENSVKFMKIHTMTDDQVARQIREDHCDIAIYLCPMFDSNRPLIAKYRAAPVQISYLDAGRTIIPNMDYLIIGRHFAPRNIIDIGTERVIGMPRFYQHPYLTDAPIPNDVPALTNGYFTFGVYNNPAKINEEVLRVWKLISEKCNCKFYFKYKGLWRNKILQDKVLEFLPRDKCIFDVGDNNFHHHLEAYMKSDLQLDTFSFNGSTTTFESLTMGVPVITFKGNTIMGNYGPGILKQAKLDEFVAKDKDEYIELAVKYANNPELLIDYRKNIRENNVKPYLCTVKPYFFVRLIKGLWHKYCKENS